MPYRLMVFRLLFILSCLIPIGMNAQDILDTVQRVMLYSGFKQSVVFDEVGSNANYSGRSIPLQLRFESLKPEDYTAVDLSFDRSEQSNHFNDHRLDVLSFSASFKKVWRVKQLSNTCIFFLGGGLTGHGMRRTFRYEEFDQTVETGELAGSLDLSGSVIKLISSRHVLSLEEDLSVLSYVFGREFIGEFTGDILLPWNSLLWRSNLTYSFHPKGPFEYSLKYVFRYFNLDRVNDYKTTYHMALLGAGIRF